MIRPEPGVVCPACGGLLPPYERHGDRALPFCGFPAEHAERAEARAVEVYGAPERLSDS